MLVVFAASSKAPFWIVFGVVIAAILVGLVVLQTTTSGRTSQMYRWRLIGVVVTLAIFGVVGLVGLSTS